MKKLLLLVAALYFVSCKTLCWGQEEQPFSASSCYSADTFEIGHQCCFLKNTNGTLCVEFEGRKTSNIIKKKHPEYANFEIDCPYKKKI